MSGDSHPVNDRVMPNLPLGEGAEFDAIRALMERWGELAQGIGDDAAALEIPRGDQLVTSVDACVQGRHFRPEWITPAEIGERATAAALSDLAAMAATPLGILVAINLPESWRDRLSEIGDGIGAAARAAKAKILGGNISAAGELSIVTTVMGHAFRPIGRGGARIGDRVYVTGKLGGPGAALRAWLAGRSPSIADRQRFVAPRPRLAEARWLANEGMHACIDISDGLVADAGHLAAASQHAIEIHRDRVSCVDGVAAAEAMASGEEYELLLTSPPLDVDAFAARFGLPLTEIGEVVVGPAELRLFDGDARVAAPKGHDHLSG